MTSWEMLAILGVAVGMFLISAVVVFAFATEQIMGDLKKILTELEELKKN